MDTKKLGINSKLVHAGHHSDQFGSAVVPIYQTSTFAFENAQNGADRFAGVADGYIYTRIGNPTIHALEVQVAELENGAGAVATSSGMGAVASIYMALLEQGAHVVSTASVYGPSRGLIEKHLSRFGVDSTYVDTTDLANITPRAQAEHADGLRREPVEPGDAGQRHPRRRRHRPRARLPAGRRQHLRQPVSASARSISAPTWCSTRSRSSSTATPTWSAASW